MTSTSSLNIYYLSYLFVLVFVSSFGIPTWASLIVVSFVAAASTVQDVTLVFFLALSASILGDTSAYWTLRLFQKKIYPLIDRNAWMKRQADIAEALFNKYSYATVFFSRFLLSGAGPVINLYSGLHAMPYRKFLRATVWGELLYCAIYTSIGYFFRDTWNVVVELAQDYITGIVFALVGLFIIINMTKYLVKHRRHIFS